MTNEQIQEARKVCDKATAVFPGNGEKDALRNLLIISTLLPAALDEIEAQQRAIDDLWEVMNGNIDCPWMNNFCSDVPCGSPECREAFMEHYLGETEHEK